MALQSTTTININGTEITNFKFLELNQSIGDHHTLDIVCRMDVLESLGDELANASKEFLGELITLEIEAYEGFGSNDKNLSFKGLVTQIHTTKGHESGKGDEIIITAKSPDFLSDDGPHYASHSETSLSEIVEKTFEDYDTSKLEIDVRPQNDPTLHYSVQQNESAYSFANRLASQYGEWLYYSGEKLIFGEPDTEELELTYGFDLKEYQLSLLPQSNNYKVFANDYLSDEAQQKATSEIDGGLSGFGSFVSEKSSAIYTKETKIWHNLYNDPQVQQRLDTAVTLQKKAIEVKQVKVTAICDNPGVKLGSVVIIDGNKYRVTTVKHSNNEVGDYSNSFEAITADIHAYPYTDINAFPISQSQVGIVKENADPDGLGRVKVQFPWQEDDGETTPWIRIVTPHAGGDKGFHFIPEIDERVLVGFEGGNAEHPYMIGSLYSGNGKANAFQSNTNAIKALQTRSGNKIILNDDSGSIEIADSNGSCIKMDGAGNISITASKKIKMLAQDIEFIARHNLSAIAGNIATLSARPGDGGGEGQVIVSAEKDLNIESKTTNASINTKEKIEIKSKSIDVIAENSLNLNGGQMADFVASIIKINS